MPHFGDDFVTFNPFEPHRYAVVGIGGDGVADDIAGWNELGFALWEVAGYMIGDELAISVDCDIVSTFSREVEKGSQDIKGTDDRTILRLVVGLGVGEVNCNQGILWFLPSDAYGAVTGRIWGAVSTASTGTPRARSCRGSPPSPLL